MDFAEWHHLVCFGTRIPASTSGDFEIIAIFVLATAEPHVNCKKELSVRPINSPICQIVLIPLPPPIRHDLSISAQDQNNTSVSIFSRLHHYVPPTATKTSFGSFFVCSRVIICLRASNSSPLHCTSAAKNFLTSVILRNFTL